MPFFQKSLGCAQHESLVITWFYVFLENIVITRLHVFLENIVITQLYVFHENIFITQFHVFLENIVITYMYTVPGVSCAKISIFNKLIKNRWYIS